MLIFFFVEWEKKMNNEFEKLVNEILELEKGCQLKWDQLNEMKKSLGDRERELLSLQLKKGEYEEKIRSQVCIGILFLFFSD